MLKKSKNLRWMVRSKADFLNYFPSVLKLQDSSKDRMYTLSTYVFLKAKYRLINEITFRLQVKILLICSSLSFTIRTIKFTHQIQPAENAV
jgi:hypothetical protein